MFDLSATPWPWYIAGALIGATVPALLLTGGRQFAVSANLRHLCALTGSRLPLFQYDWKRQGGWNLMFAAGLVLGGWLAGTFLVTTPVAVHISDATTADLRALRLSDLGGLARGMPSVFLLFMIGALSISAMPLLSGFVSKTMIIEAAADERLGAAYLLMSAASAITFMAVTLRLGWFAFFDRPCVTAPSKALPANMLVAMTIAAALCFLIGVLPAQFYQLLPDAVEYHAYTIGHLLWELQLLLFAGLVFFLLRERLRPRPGVALDVDWLYRRLLSSLAGTLQRGVDQVWSGLLRGMQRQLLWLLENVNRHHGPQGVLARTWPTGSMVLWVAVLLAGSLLVYYL
jgi:multicomponent Na+:H+ antiporter subunit D